MKEKRNFMKEPYSAFESKYKGFENPVKKFKRYRNNIKCAYQRVKYGYCYRDVWSIDWWFLSVMPNMIEDLRLIVNGYPSELLVCNVQECTEIQEKNSEAMDKWDSILAEMARLLRDAHVEQCSMKNQYEEEHAVAMEEFTQKYGLFGEKLLTPEEIERDKKEKLHTMHLMNELPEYKDISDKYSDEEEKIDAYRKECKEKGIDLFQKWFWYLGD